MFTLDPTTLHKARVAPRLHATKQKNGYLELRISDATTLCQGLRSGFACQLNAHIVFISCQRGRKLPERRPVVHCYPWSATHHSYDVYSCDELISPDLIALEDRLHLYSEDA